MDELLILEGRPVTVREIDKLARSFADRMAPQPKKSPIEAGLLGALITAIVVAAFLAIAGLRQETFQTAMLATCLLGFAGPYLYFWQAERKNTHLFVKRYTELMAQARQEAALAKEAQTP